jgi:hypothetical protein
MAQPTVDINSFSTLKGQMEQIVAARKATKSKLEEVQKSAVKVMMQMKCRYIDEKGDGTGPFWTLCKDTKEGSWKAERYNEFFAGVLTELAKGTRFTPEQLTTLAQQYLKQFEKRDLKIEKHTTARRRDVDDLIAWLQEGAQT